jgi:hypothetical protein
MKLITFLIQFFKNLFNGVNNSEKELQTVNTQPPDQALYFITTFMETEERILRSDHFKMSKALWSWMPKKLLKKIAFYQEEGRYEEIIKSLNYQAGMDAYTQYVCRFLLVLLVCPCENIPDEFENLESYLHKPQLNQGRFNYFIKYLQR